MFAWALYGIVFSVVSLNDAIEIWIYKANVLVNKVMNWENLNEEFIHQSEKQIFLLHS